MPKTLRFKKVFFTLILGLFVPASLVLAQAGAPTIDANATFGASSLNGEFSASIFGAVNLPNNIPLSDIALMVVVLDEAVVPANYGGNYNTFFFGDGNDFAPGNVFSMDLFNVDGSTPFVAGEDYQFIFKLASQSDAPLFQPVYASVNATVPSDAVINPNGADTSSDGQPDLNPGNITFDSTIHNPLGVDVDLLDFLRKLFRTMVKIALPFLVIFMIYSGFMFVEAQGNEEKLSKAKKNFLYVIIGACLIFGAWLIATVLKGTVDQIEAPVVFLEMIINLV